MKGTASIPAKYRVTPGPMKLDSGAYQSLDYFSMD